jgi:hypothetical protein
MKTWTLFLMLALFVAPVFAEEPGAMPERTFLVHVTTLLDSGNDRTVLVPRVIAAALHKGYTVVLLFDGEGVLSLKTGRWFGGHSTPLDRVDIVEPERQHLAGF